MVKARLLLWVYLCLCLRIAQAETANVRLLFADAQQIYASGDFEKAAKAFARNLEKFPDHGPSQLFLAKSLFRLHRYENAWSVFQKLANDPLDQESKYEAGYSAYRNKSWKRGSEILSSIPESSPSFDLAMYYAAVCLINLNRLSEAEQALKKSIVLPPRFAASRKNLLSYVKGELSNQTSPQSSPQTTPQNSPAKQQKPVLKPETIEEEFTEESNDKGTGSSAPKRSLGLFYDLQSYKQNMAGIDTASGTYQRSGAYVQGSYESATSGYGYFADFSGEGSQANASGNAVSTGLTIFQKEDIWPSLLGKISQKGPKTDLRFSLKPGISYQMDSMNVGAFGILRLVDNGDSSNRGGGGGARLFKQVGKFKINIAAEASSWTSDVYAPLTSYSGLLESQLVFGGDFTLNFGISRQVLDASEESVEIPLGLSQANFKVAQGLGFGLSVDASGSFATLDNLLKTNPQGGSTTADGTQVSWEVGLNWSPLKWFVFSINQYISNYTWSHVDPEVNRPTWDGSVPDYEELSTLNFKFYRAF